jgi:hypothetical protein
VININPPDNVQFSIEECMLCENKMPEEDMKEYGILMVCTECEKVLKDNE